MANRTNTRARNPRQDLSGKRFRKLVARHWLGGSSWLCDCDCGGTKTVTTNNLNRGKVVSCGCIKPGSKRGVKHGLYHTHAYRTWCGVKRRCFEVTHSAYPRYGGAGITMHEDWISDPVSFIEHVGQPPSAGHTLDRIDNKLGYVPGNLRWATVLEQNSNKRNNRIVSYQGATYTISQLARKVAEECGITQKQFQNALQIAMYRRSPHDDAS